MTNLTSEQYRDVLRHIPNCTTEIPTVRDLLRRGVQLFFKRFGAYPELGGVAPGKVGLFGEQLQLSDGLSLTAAIPLATIIVGRRVPGKQFTVVTSADVGKPHKVKFSFSRNRPLAPGCPTWLNYIKGVIDSYPETVPPFEAAIESSIPMGEGLGSTAALEVATYSFLTVLLGKRTEPIEEAQALQKAEKEFAGKKVGLLDRISAIMSKDRHAFLSESAGGGAPLSWTALRSGQVKLVAVNTHLKDELFGDEYPERTKYLKKACELLGVDTLNDCTEEHLNELENRVNELLLEAEERKEEEEEDEEEEEEEGEEEGRKLEAEIWTKEEYDIMIKRARFFITETNRITQSLAACIEGDVEVLGKKLTESHKSLKEDFDFNNPVLNFLVETSLEVEGVLGSRMSGMGLGLGGTVVSLVRIKDIEKYCTYVKEKFAEYESQLCEEMWQTKQQEKQRQFEIKKRFHSEHFNPSIASSEKIGQVQEYLESGGVIKKAPKRFSTDSSKRSSLEGNTCLERKKIPCIVKVEKPQGGCGTWARFQKDRDKEEFFRKLSIVQEELQKMQEQEGKGGGGEGGEEEAEGEAMSSTKVSEASSVMLQQPNFYILSPFTGTRMLFVTKTDILRSRYAMPIPHPKALVRTAIKEFEATYENKVEAIGLAPSTMSLFGEFMEFHLGYVITLTLPMYVVTVGGRNDTVLFSFKTTSTEVENPPEMKSPLPSVRPLKMESRSWVNYVTGVVNEFKGVVPGFNAVVHSSAPTRVGLHTCAALQSSIYTFLENLTRQCTTDLFEKVQRCSQSEVDFVPTHTELISRCSSMKFLSIFLCKEGHLMQINCKNHKVSHHFFDDPSYAFLIATCKQNTTDITVETLEQRLKQCMEAIDILDRNSLLYLDQKHLKCLKKRDAPEEVIKRAKYVITEHQRTLEAVKAIKEQDYARVGLLMNQSHASLRDDYEVSSPQIEALIELALSAEGVLGAKMIGTGLNASIAVLIKLSDADKCIRYMRKNYKDKSDKPVFYIIKPAGGAFSMSPTVDVPYIL